MKDIFIVLIVALCVVNCINYWYNTINLIEDLLAQMVAKSQFKLVIIVQLLTIICAIGIYFVKN